MPIWFSHKSLIRLFLRSVCMSFRRRVPVEITNVEKPPGEVHSGTVSCLQATTVPGMAWQKRIRGSRWQSSF